MTNKGKHTIIKTLCKALALGLFCLGLSCLTLPISNPITQNTLADDNTKAGILTTNYLSAPELIEANQTSGILFVYDSYTRKVMSFNPSTQELIATSTWSGKVLSLCHTDTHLLALIEESESNNSLYLINETTLEKTKLNSPIYDQMQIDCFTACGEKVYMYVSSEELIETAIINATENTLDDRTMLASRTQFGGDALKSLMLSSETLYYTTENDGTYSVCKLNDDGDGNIEKTTIYTSPDYHGEFLYSTPHNESANCILTSNNYLLTINGDSVSSKPLPQANINSTLSSVTFIGATKYFADENAQTIWKLENNSNNLVAVFKNASPTPAITNASEHEYLEITKTTGIYATPYATSTIKDLEVGSKLTVIAKDDASYDGFHYCLYTTKTENIYGYIKIDDSFITLAKTAVYIPLKVIGDNNNFVYYLPSGISDQHNTGFKQLDALSITTQVIAQKVTNSAGDDFYLIELENGIYGYIRYSQVTTNFATIQTERIKCNGKTKRDTTLYISPSSVATTTYTDDEIESFNNVIQIKSNTRILLNEKVKAGDKYTKVTYQTETGETYYGYVATADLDADGLTPLQTVGVILVAVNILILVIILVIRKSVITDREKSIQSVD
ncbi:MAG: hypothetical protein J6J23_04050 [Clostridia bacterium]|nr:hypothetical protein [Clostridia bacterium]